MTGGSPFNEYQTDYMRSLSKVPLEEKCWCGWYRLGACPNCRPGETCAERVAASCEACGNFPAHRGDTRPLTHRFYCPKSPRNAPSAPEEPSR